MGRPSLRGMAAQRADRAQMLRAELEATWFDYEDADRRLRLYRETLVPTSEEALGVVTQAYRAGSAPFIELIEAQRTVLELQLGTERAFAEREQALAAVEAFVPGAVRPAGTGHEGAAPSPAQDTGIGGTQ